MYMVHNGHLKEEDWKLVSGAGGRPARGGAVAAEGAAVGAFVRVRGGGAAAAFGRAVHAARIMVVPVCSFGAAFKQQQLSSDSKQHGALTHSARPPRAPRPQVKSLAPADVPVLTLAPHVSASLGNRSLSMTPDWILPILPFQSANPCTLKDLQEGRQCIRGFSVQVRAYARARARRARPARVVAAWHKLRLLWFAVGSVPAPACFWRSPTRPPGPLPQQHRAASSAAAATTPRCGSRSAATARATPRSRWPTSASTSSERPWRRSACQVGRRRLWDGAVCGAPSVVRPRRRLHAGAPRAGAALQLARAAAGSPTSHATPPPRSRGAGPGGGLQEPAIPHILRRRAPQLRAGGCGSGSTPRRALPRRPARRVARARARASRSFSCAQPPRAACAAERMSFFNLLCSGLDS